MNDLLPGFEPITPAPKLSADRRRTQKRKDLIAAGVHPATGLPIIKNDPRTCGGCANLLRKENPAQFAGHFWKCQLTITGRNDGPDVRRSWPACTSFKAVEQ